MRILSITLRNYRVHKELTLNLDHDLVLIGGPNESGKSTLAEAMHRGLCLRSKATGAIVESMASDHGGVPEVQVNLRLGGHDYNLTKQFRKQSGSTTLSRQGHTTLKGEDAESELYRLLRTEAPGRTTEAWVKEQWPHLWVWQRDAGNDPAASLEGQGQDLLSRLQTMGGAGLVTSNQDGKVAKIFSDLKGDIFGIRDEVKKSSRLGLARQAEAEAAQAEADATKRLEEVQASMDAIQEAGVTLQTTARDLAVLSEEAERLRAREEQLSTLRQRATELAGATEKSKSEVSALQEIDAEITQLRNRALALETRLQPTREKVDGLKKQLRESIQKLEGLQKATQEAREAGKAARRKVELLKAVESLAAESKRLQELTRKQEKASELEAQKTELLSQRAKLPQVSRADLNQLKKLQKSLDELEFTVKSVATGVELLGGGSTVLLDGEALQPGEEKVVTQPALLAIGDALQIRIRPGGGTSLTQSLEQLHAARESRDALLEKLGTKDLEAAEAALTLHGEYSSQIDKLDALLQGMDVNALPGQVSRANLNLEAARAEIERRREGMEQAAALIDLPEAQLHPTLEAAVSELETAEKALLAWEIQLDKESGLRKELEQKTEAAQKTLETDQEELTRQANLLRDRLEKNGDEERRSARLKEATLRWEQDKAALAEVDTQIQALQPDLLVADKERNARAQKQGEADKTNAEIKRQTAQHILNRDGSTDPYGDLQVARAVLERARQTLATEEVQARAIRLLDTLFVQEQQKLSDQLSQPLADKIGDYLKCMFGPQVQAAVTLDAGQKMQGIRLVRPGSGYQETTDFLSLSGGAREQMSAAVRLAAAELLAQNYDGCLPVIFDDAFAYSDPDRVATLQRMLDLAARRGLQVIILSCNPSDYTGLGAHKHLLPAPTRSDHTSPGPAAAVPNGF